MRKIVLDSDVVITGLISPKGAGCFLLTSFLPHRKIKILTSKKQIKEIKEVLKRPEFTWTVNEKLWENFNKQAVKIKLPIKLSSKLTKCLLDPDDIHILASAVAGKAKFLLTYNLRHYHREEIKKELGISVVHPGSFLQFWRLKERIS